MAKKITTSTIEGGKSILDIIKSVDSNIEILSETDSFTIKDYIDTGSYILNACMTGSLFKGVPGGRIVTLAGPSGSGKTYLALSICRNAQKMGYTVLYLDSEGAIDTEFVKRLGCDGDGFGIASVSTVSQVSTLIANTCKAVEESKTKDKMIIVLDSLGNLTSDKELNDTLGGEKKRDMTRQQDTKALFRTNAAKLAKLGIPFIVVSHIYQTMDLFSKQVVSGGTGLTYSASLTLMLNAGKLEDKESDKIVQTKNGDYTKTGVVVTAKAEKSRYTIPQKVQIKIPYFKAPNPYIGLERYIDWDNSGIMQGEILYAKDYDKLPQGEKDICREMADENGEICYAHPKGTSRKIVVNHLHKAIPMESLWTPEVFTEDVLKNLDETVIKPLFELPSQDSFDDLKEYIEENE